MAEADTENRMDEVATLDETVIEAEPGPANEPDTVPSSTTASTTTQVDLRSLEYVSEFDKNIVCPICRCPFVNPVRLSCDHTFCRDCLDTALFNQSSTTKSCPACRTRNAHHDRLTVPRFILHMLDDLVVKCPKSTSGCTYSLKRSDVQDHVDYYCEFTDIPCPSTSCKLLISRKYGNDKCLHGQVSCEHCGLKMMEFESSRHAKSECKVKTAPCIWCKKQFSLADSEIHSSECPEARLKCPAHSVGCQFDSKKDDMPAHAQSCPLVALLPTLQSMANRIDNQNATIDSLRLRNKSLEQSVAAFQSMVTDSSSSSSLFTVPPVLNNISQSTLDNQTSSEAPLFDSATHHMLSMHESLREELDRLSAAISEVDGRTSMAIINETLRIREDLTHTNAAISSLRIQLQWLTSARLHAQQRGPFGAPAVPAMGSRNDQGSSSNATPTPPVRRLSDSARQDTKL